MYDKLCDKLDTIIDDMSRKEKLTASDLQVLDWATHIKKSMMATEDGGYSTRGYSTRKRDSMGRYSREDRGGGYSRNYSRDSREEYKDQLYSMMEEAPDEKTRMSIQRMLREMEA